MQVVVELCMHRIAAFVSHSRTQCPAIQPRLAPTPLFATRADLYRADLSAKEFQLEELEDKEESETELWLNADGTVTLGRTNGPPVKDFKGDWHVLETAGEGDKPFRMRLTRSYESPR